MTEPVLTVRGCRWIAIPGATDPRGSINFLEYGKGLDFPAKRVYWLHPAAADQSGDPHAHRKNCLVLVALSGGCLVHLDDGAFSESVVLNEPGRGVLIAPLVWHELTDFAEGSVVLAMASDVHDEAEYLRNYSEFKQLVASRAP